MLAVVYGYIVPMLISAAFTLANLLAVVIAVIVPAIMYKIWIKKPKTQANNEND